MPYDGATVQEGRMSAHRFVAGFALFVVSGVASAQTSPADAPPPGYATAPPAAAAPYPYPTATSPPPPGYPPPGYYGYPGQKGPKTLPYEEGQAIPPGYYLDEGPIKGLLIAGPIVFGVPYLLGLTIASGTGYPNASGWLVAPVIGPWITLGAREDACGSDPVDYSDTLCESENNLVRTWLVLDGILQAGGVAMFIAGMVSRRKRLLRQDVAQVTVAPTMVGTGYGLGAFGTF
jgi:hypothetical protein